MRPYRKKKTAPAPHPSSDDGDSDYYPANDDGHDDDGHDDDSHDDDSGGYSFGRCDHDGLETAFEGSDDGPRTAFEGSDDGPRTAFDGSEDGRRNAFDGSDSPVPSPNRTPSIPMLTAGVLSAEGEGRQVMTCPNDALLPTTKNENKRQWKSSDTIILLKQIVSYSKQNGECKLSVPYLSGFYSSLRASPISSNYSDIQVHNKVKRLKRKFKELSRKKGTLSPTQKEILKIGGKLWGEAGKATEEEEVDDEEDIVMKNVDIDSEEEDDPEILLWTNAMQNHCGKMFDWPGMYTMSKIDNWRRLNKVSMAKEWLKEKCEVDRSVLKLSDIEEECLNVMVSSPSAAFTG